MKDNQDILEALERIAERLAALEAKVESLEKKISPTALAEAFYEMPIPRFT